MKIIIFYGRRNTALICLPFLIAKGYKIKVISDDESILWAAKKFGLEIVEGFENMGDFDIFISIHGWQIVPMRYLKGKIAFNIHPCLTLGYKGKSPIDKYIANKNTIGDVTSHYMIAEADEGSIIHSEIFSTSACNNPWDFYNYALKEYLYCLETTLKIVDK